MPKSNYRIFLLNLKKEKPYCEYENIWEELCETDFYEIFKSHFSKIKTTGNHNGIVGEDYKIYFYYTGKKEEKTEISVDGRKGVLQILDMAKNNNLGVVIPSIDDNLIDLRNIENHGFENIEEFFKSRN